MKLALIYPGMGKRPGQRYIRTWQMEPLPSAALAGLTPTGVDIDWSLFLLLLNADAYGLRDLLARLSMSSKENCDTDSEAVREDGHRNGDCGAGGFCSMDQEDTYPAGGDSIGDACFLCEADFDLDGDVDGTDASAFKADFGRTAFIRPCDNASTCNGDFSCDRDVDGSDAALFKTDFDRSTFNKRCPARAEGEWCVYQ